MKRCLKRKGNVQVGKKKLIPLSLKRGEKKVLPGGPAAALWEEEWRFEKNGTLE